MEGQNLILRLRLGESAGKRKKVDHTPDAEKKSSGSLLPDQKTGTFDQKRFRGVNHWNSSRDE